METFRRPAHTRCHAAAKLGIALLLTATGLRSTIAADTPDNAAEREQLAALTRQLDLANRLAEQAAKFSPSDRARYHFDYDRLREDVKRVRTGVQDYLVPQRAQPRDPIPLMGDYVRTDATSDKEAAKP